MTDTLDAVIAAASNGLPALCRRFHVRHLDLFGSAANGRFDPERSDLDFLVAFEESSGSSGRRLFPPA